MITYRKSKAMAALDIAPARQIAMHKGTFSIATRLQSSCVILEVLVRLSDTPNARKPHTIEGRISMASDLLVHSTRLV
jgi:hypothetical protein